MADIRFWLGMLHRAALKRNDKLMVGNVDSGKPDYIDVAEILSVLTTDDLPEGDVKKYMTPGQQTTLADLEALAGDILTLTEAQGYFYPKSTNPSGYLTDASSIAAAKITGLLAAALIPNLAAGKITSGTFSAARIPNLPASKITSGTFPIARIPMIPVSKIEGFALYLANYILKTAIGAANGVTPLDANVKVPVGYIPGLDASKIVSGVFAEERFPDIFLRAAQIIDNLISTDPDAPLSANQGRVLREDIEAIVIPEIVDALTSLDATKTLSANQGRILKGFIDDINTLLASDDTTLDQLQEIVTYIKQNKTDLQDLSISNIAGLVDALAGKQPLAPLGYGFSQEDFTTPEKQKLAKYAGKTEFGINGTIDGANTTFTTEQPFTPGHTKVYLNGIRQYLGADYTEPSNTTIQFIDPPVVPDKIIIDY